MSFKLYHYTITILWLIVEILVAYATYRREACLDKKWFRILFGTFGPRTDVPSMSRRELFRSARIFLVWTLHCGFCLVAIGGGIIRFYGDQQPPLVLLAIFCFVLPTLTLIFLASSAYLFLRGIMRRPAYDRHLAEYLEYLSQCENALEEELCPGTCVDSVETLT